MDVCTETVFSSPLGTFEADFIVPLNAFPGTAG